MRVYNNVIIFIRNSKSILTSKNKNKENSQDYLN